MKKDYELFGRLVWEWIIQQDDFTGNEFSEDILPLAEKAGMVEWVIYDPEIHGYGIEAEPGDRIWFWRNSK